LTNSRAGCLMLVGAPLLLLLSGCGETAAQQAQAAPERNPLEITPNEDLLKQIKIGTPQWRSVSETLRVAARVEANETQMARVSAPVTGRIVELKAIEGQTVHRGEVLATIYSTELSSAQSALLKAHSQRQLADRAVARARQLLSAGVIGEAELQRREAELQQASADVAAAREQLGVLGLPEDRVKQIENTRAVNSITHIVSSIDGMILERKATIGQIVQAVEPVFVVADLSGVWLVADVPEQSAGALEMDKTVEAEIPALPGEKIAGKLSFVSAVVNPDTRTVRVRMDLPNPNRRYKPAMLATMTLVDGAERRLVVPATAVVRDGNTDCVFIQSKPGTFVLQRVDVGDEFEEGRVLLDGLRETDTIVLEGAFNLNNDRKRQGLGGEEG
jgi:membrane fusion protein, heavy metal efflux system